MELLFFLDETGRTITLKAHPGDLNAPRKIILLLEAEPRVLIKRRRLSALIGDQLIEQLAGSVVVMDNHRAHVKLSKESKEELAKNGIKIVLLPPYHPELNPIEYFWSRFKAHLRKKKADAKLALSGDR